MAESRIEDLLGVKWFDGLVVGSRHLTHSDRRVQGLLAEICHGALDQPGLTGGERVSGVTPAQLIQLESIEATQPGSTLKLVLTRSFVAVSLSGRISIGYRDESSGIGRHFTASLPQPATDGQLLVCVRQQDAEELKVERRVDSDSKIDLTYPALDGLAVPHRQFTEGVAADYADYVPIGALIVEKGRPVVDQKYIPPVLKLSAVNAFDDGIVPKISAHWERLFRAVSEKVDAAGAAFAQGQGGADLMKRRTDYEALRTLLLSTWGMARNIAGVSPTGLLFGAVQPVAVWWDFHRGRHFPNLDLENKQSPVAAVSRLARTLANMTRRDLCAGSSDLLVCTNEFLHGVTEVLAVA